MINTNMANVVTDVAELLERYTITEVEHALQYVRTYPTMPVMPELIELYNPRGNNFKLTTIEYNSLLETVPHMNKISAIKVLREITQCSLIEAKETIEHRWW